MLLHQVISHQNTSYINHVRTDNLLDVANFEQSFVQPLAEDQAYALLRQGISNQLAHPSPDASSVKALKLQKVRVLDSGTRGQQPVLPYPILQ